jgi:periplasmic protein TonB
VSFDALRDDAERDQGRTKRLAGSYIVALVVLAAFLGVGAAFGGQIKKQLVEEEVDVKFVPPEPPKAPPPPPPPPPKVANKQPPPQGAKRDAPPTELPSGPPAEGDPNHAKEALPIGDENGCLGCTGNAPAPKPTVTAPPEPPAPPPPPVVQVAEASTQPVPLTKSMPAYPEDARKQGIEAVVVVKFIVSENGQVEEPRVIKGHPLFDEIVLAAVRSWTFQPATLDGKTVRMVRMVKIPFRLKHT